jgi:hypothetical protein
METREKVSRVLSVRRMAHKLVLKLIVAGIALAAPCMAIAAQGEVRNANHPQPSSAGTQALFDLSAPGGSPFPSNRFTVPDTAQNTRLRVNLPLTDCSNPAACYTTRTINLLDGFNVQPRLSIPFSGQIDPNSVNSSDVFLVSLGSTKPGGAPPGRIVGINQIVWSTLSNTLHAESNDLLAQHTRYALIVTNGVRDVQGKPVIASDAFKSFPKDLLFGKNQTVKAYEVELSLALIAALLKSHTDPRNVVAASVFTTQSVTATLEKIRNQIHGAKPAPADFMNAPGGTRAFFNAGDITAITWNVQYQDVPPALFPVATDYALGFSLAPAAVGKIAYGRYSSPNYLNPDVLIPTVGTLTGVPAVLGANEIYFNLVLPSGPKPAHGWPVAIFGHFLSGAKDFNMPYFMAIMAEHGIATLYINAVGHGWGPQSTITLTMTDNSSTTIPAPGRTVDQNGDDIIDGGAIFSNVPEGFLSTGPNAALHRDSEQQTAADLMQLVREIEVGMDVDGDGVADLDSSRIYYFGQSQGGIYGTLFMAVEPDVRAGVLNVAGGPLLDVSRLEPVGNVVSSLLPLVLGSQVPSLINGPGNTFIANVPLRDQPPLVDSASGAEAIQAFLDDSEWIDAAGECVPYARHLRKEPLTGVPAKSIVVQFAKGDETVPNPLTTALIRAGDIGDRATYFRNDLAFADHPVEALVNPHGFLSTFGNSFSTEISKDGQDQIATFFESDGDNTINPDPTYFEVPIAPPLPESLNFLP